MECQLRLIAHSKDDTVNVAEFLVTKKASPPILSFLKEVS